MDILLQRHSARYIYVTPDGLKELMSDISREVIRANPESIYTFIADYLDALLITRENARVAARVVQSLTEVAQTAVTFLQETEISREDIDQILDAIKHTFKKSIESGKRSEVSEEVEEANIVEEVMQEITIDPESAGVAAKIIQQAFRRFRERKKQEDTLMAGFIDWRVAARSAIKLYRRTGVSNVEANRAATLIKAAYKGYYTRKILNNFAKKPSLSQHDERESLEMPELQEVLLESIDDKQKEVASAEGKVGFGLGGDKTVTINYDTVIPHVDFDEEKRSFVLKDDEMVPESAAEEMEHQTSTTSSIEKPQSSTTSSIVKHQISYALNATFESLEHKGSIGEPPIPTRSFLKKSGTINRLSRDSNV